ncbi:MAG: M15 family metallopeptidase [Coxiellaceae bacterium]|nr:M15 family metallopeptidase [Coxiellaceae bacterium]
MKARQLFILISTLTFPILIYALPKGFVYLNDVAPSVLQDIRYAGYHNFTGRPVKGYRAKECILTKPAADALAKVQAALLQSDLSLKVYDCYRPQRAVNDFIAWSHNPKLTKMKAEFYPRVAKNKLFAQGYIAKKSGHSRGSTVDLTIVPVPTRQQANYYRGQTLVSCTAAYHERFADNSIDMGTGYDCLDPLSYGYTPRVSLVAYQNRKLLRHIMQKYGFMPYKNEWWHFTLRREPYPETYFNFPIKPE